jgi:hypothetical protein
MTAFPFATAARKASCPDARDAFALLCHTQRVTDPYKAPSALSMVEGRLSHNRNRKAGIHG